MSSRSPLLVVVALLVPAAVGAQSIQCPNCVLGLYDDAAMTRTTGEVSGPTKDLYLGIRYAGGEVQGLVGIEFGISGLDSFLVTIEPLDSPTAVIGTPAVPSGLDSLHTGGGMNIAWPVCLPGDRVLAKLTLRPRTSWPRHAGLRVKHRYPPANPTIPFPLFNKCDDPVYTSMALSGGTYSLGPDEPPACGLTAPRTDFGVVLDGQSAFLTFTVANTGGHLLNGAVRLNGADFALENNYGYSSAPEYSLLGGESRLFGLRFTPTVPGERICWISSSDCDSLQFVGRLPNPVPIRTLQESGATYLGALVSVEGQPYLPPAPTLNGYEAWLQDESGRGVRLVGGSILLQDLFHDPSNHLRVRGRPEREGPTLVLGSIEYAGLFGSKPPMAPALVPTGTFNGRPGFRDSTLSGTFVEVFGSITGIAHVGAEVQYSVDDGSGIALTRVRPPDRQAYEIGDRIHAAGAVEFLELAAGWRPVLAVRRSEDLTMTGRLLLSPIQTPLGAIVDVHVRLQANPDPIDNFTLRLACEGGSLRFLGGSCCGLTAGWSGCEFSPAGPDTLVVHATGSTPIPPQSDGDAICVSFQADACGPTALHLIDLTGGVAEMRIADGWYACSDCAADGDVNADGTLTPSDALCAFQSFLNGGHAIPECDAAGECETAASDVSCDGRILPGDAYWIFNRWLYGDGAPESCFAHTLVSQPNGGTAFRISAGVPAGDASGNVALPIERRAIAGGAAFAVVVEFDPTQSEFVEWRPADGVRWVGLGARALAPGRIQVGGFAADLGGAAPQNSSAAGWEPVGDLVLRSRRAASALNRIEWLEAFAGQPADPATPDATPRTLRVGMPRPNPVRGRDVVLDVAVPGGLGTALEIHVLDIRGRLLRRLDSGPLAAGPHAIVWDRRDARGREVAAGLYIVRVRAADHVEQRKLVVLQ